MHETDTAAGPTYSILIEADNVVNAGLNSLEECLSTLESQDLSGADAVVLIESGQLSSEALRQLRRQFPWLTFHRLDPDVLYASMKGQSSGLVKSDIVVLCDSDCRYQREWLKYILEPFRDMPDVNIVGGETTTSIHGPYSLAIALTYIFPRYSGERHVARSQIYWANNVAARRDLLCRLPVPDPRSLYRGQNIIHSQAATAAGYTIWRAPQARALHVLPTLAQLPRRYFLLGRDSVNIARLTCDESGQRYRGDMDPDAHTGGRLTKFYRRFRSVTAENSRYWVYLPLAIPVMIFAAVFYFAGNLAARFSSLAENSSPTSPDSSSR